MAKLITIERHILEQQQYYPAATGAFTNLMYDIALAAKLIAKQTTRAGLADVLGDAGTTNIQGENQQILDVYADHTIVRMLDHTGRIAIMGSEERDEPIEIPERYPAGSYVILFDPLDGSSNISYNVSIGTIFSIYRKISGGKRGTMADLLQPGHRQVGAGYIIFGSSTMLVYTSGQGVHGYTLDPSIGEFILSHENIRIPETPKYYSVNQGYERFWRKGVRKYMSWLRDLGDDGPPKNLSSRYIGSLVADFHRNLLAGGIFMYPADKRNPDKPFGKLRLCYETAALAFIAEAAGGYASDGIQPILNVQPYELHQRTPFYVGNRELVEKVEEYIAEYDQKWIKKYKAQLEEFKPPAVNGEEMMDF